MKWAKIAPDFTKFRGTFGVGGPMAAFAPLRAGLVWDYISGCDSPRIKSRLDSWLELTCLGGPTFDF